MRETSGKREIEALRRLGWTVEIEVDGSYWRVRLQQGTKFQGSHGRGGRAGMVEALRFMLDLILAAKNAEEAVR